MDARDGVVNWLVHVMDGTCTLGPPKGRADHLDAVDVLQPLIHMPHTGTRNNDESIIIRSHDIWLKQRAGCLAQMRISDFNFIEATCVCEQEPLTTQGDGSQQLFVSQAVAVKKEALIRRISVNQIEQRCDRFRFRREVRKRRVCKRHVETK